MEEGKWSEPKTGTPQGSVISPLLANVYLHYAFDLWVDAWRKKWAQGEVVVVRYADDVILGFQYQTDADRFLDNLRERLAMFGLELHPDKTRRIGQICRTGNAPLAVTRARDAARYWRRKRTTDMYPLLWLKGFVSIFCWDPRESPKMLASVEDLVQEEDGGRDISH